jgi:hypothetical protein
MSKNAQLVWSVLVWAVAGAVTGSCQAQTLQILQTLQTFPLAELFGVSWPTQPIEFRYDGGQPPLSTTRMVGPSGTEVPYQWVSSCSDATAVKGCILVDSNLPANASYTWTLQSNIAPQATVVNPVVSSVVNGPAYGSQTLQYYQLTNGLTGIRIISPASNPSPYNLAPIQGVLLPNGVWTGVGASPNFLYSESQAQEGNVAAPQQTPMYTATSYTVSFTDSGPMKTVMLISYTFNRPQYYYGNEIVNTAGQGHYNLIVTMYSNSKSVLIDEDSDTQFTYYLPVYAQLQPDTARFRGHDVPSPICGYEAAVPVTGATNAAPIVLSANYSLSNGQQVELAGIAGNTAANGIYYAQTSGYPAGQFALYQDPALTMPIAGSGNYTGGGVMKPAYRGWLLSPPQDAYLDLTYTGDRPPSWQGCTATTYRSLVSYYPPDDHGAGWYLEMYNSTAGSAAPVFGVYEGRLSKQINSDTYPNTPGPYTSNQHWITGTIAAGIEMINMLRGPANNIVTDVHRNWGIRVSTQADLLPTNQYQPIATDENTLDSINLSHLYSYQLTYSNPPGGWQWLYVQPAAAQQMISLVTNGTSVCGSVNCYYNLLDAYATSAEIFQMKMWQGNSTAAVQTALNYAISYVQPVINAIANGDDQWYPPYSYYQIGSYVTVVTPLLNAIIMDSNTTPAQQSLAKAVLALFACIMWDDDWFPIDIVGGAGLTNQTEMYYQYRTELASAIPSQPVMAADMATAVGYTTNDFDQYFSPTGAVPGSTYYQAAYFDPLIINFQALTLAGYLNMNDPKWTAYANWELSIQTPPEPRFGNIRKWYSNGAGATAGDARTGILATALKTVNPTLASNLMWAWQQSNTPTSLTEDATIGSIFLIDPTIPAVMPQLGSINVPGYHSVERQNFATPHETVAWFINGGFYDQSGHRDFDDGQVSIYAHAAPLSIDWNATLDDPATYGRFMHDSIVYDSEQSNSWSADQPLLTNPQTFMNNPTNTEFGAFLNSTTASATFSFPTDGTVWTRMVRTMAFDPTYPIIYVTDNFSGPSATAGKTLTWNMMATGAVTTPAGSITPIPRFSAGCQSPAGALPSNGTVNNLGSGLQQFNFTGFTWPQHATGGIDWDLFTLSSSTGQQFLIGNWGHGCHPTREVNEYQAANGAPFAEIQDILRIHGTGPFTSIILPYRKTETPTRTVTQQSCGVQITQGSEITCFNPSAAQYSNGAESILTVYDGSTQSAFGVTAAGGPQEVVIQTGQIVWTLSGVEATTRSLTLPGNWYPSQPVAQTGNTFTYSFPGGQQTTPVTITFTP